MKWLMLLSVSLFGCTEYVVRDPVVYQVELEQYDSWATQQAALLKGFIARTCACNAEGNFENPQCALAADYVLTVEARAKWHKEMSLHLAGLRDSPPEGVIPPIPLSNSLCP